MVACCKELIPLGTAASAALVSSAFLFPAPGFAAVQADAGTTQINYIHYILQHNSIIKEN